MLSKFASSDIFASSTSSIASFSLSFSSSTSSSSYLNENGKRKIETQLALPQRPRQLFVPSLRTTSCSSSSSDLSSMQTVEKSELFPFLLKKISEKIISPSTEFSKLDISFMNPCFENNKLQLKSSKRANTSTTSSSGVFSENSKESMQLIDSINAIESPSSYTIDLVTPTYKNPMFENPMFSLTSTNLYPKLKQEVETFTNIKKSIKKDEKNIETWATCSTNKTTKHLSNTENQRCYSGFSSCKSLMRNIIRRNHQTQASDSLLNKISCQNKAKCFFQGTKKDNLSLNKKTEQSCYSELKHGSFKKLPNFRCQNMHNNNSSQSSKDLLFGRLNCRVRPSNAIRCINLFSKKTKINTLPTVHDVDDFLNNQEVNHNIDSKTYKNIKHSQSNFKKSHSNSTSSLNSTYALNTGNKNDENKTSNEYDRNCFDELTFSLNKNLSNSLYPKIFTEENYSGLYSTPITQNDITPPLRYKTSTMSLHQLITTSTTAASSSGNSLINNENNTCNNTDSPMEAACRDPERASISSASSLEIAVK